MTRANKWELIEMRQNKYGNRKVTAQWKGKEVRFDSVRELTRAKELELLEKAGVITDLQRQKKFELQPSFTDVNGHRQRAITYVCDFFYKEGDTYIIEDVKSPVTANNAVYRMKRKMMLYRGYVIREEM